MKVNKNLFTIKYRQLQTSLGLAYGSFEYLAVGVSAKFGVARGRQT